MLLKLGSQPDCTMERAGEISLMLSNLSFHFSFTRFLICGPAVTLRNQRCDYKYSNNSNNSLGLHSYKKKRTSPIFCSANVVKTFLFCYLTAVSPFRLKSKEHAFNPEKMLVNPKRLLRPRAFSHPTF